MLRLLLGLILGSKGGKNRTLKKRRRSLGQKKSIVDPRLKILLPLVCILILFNLGLEEGGILGFGRDNTVNVLIYNGSDADYNGVAQIKEALNKVNTENNNSEVKFEVKTADIINQDTLSGIDVLVMPGGIGKSFLTNERVNGTAVKEFVASGNGYVGICAGAYSGAHYTEGSYEGWDVAPNVNCKPSDAGGNLTVHFTSEGGRILGQEGTQNISHVNGPAMYTSSYYVFILATYADNSTGYQNYAAIVGDYYGRGRSVLSGVHPEASPQNAELLAKMIAWAAKVRF